MRITHFDDDLVSDVRSGARPLTQEERDFLVRDTPSFEECSSSSDELSAMSDAELMSTAYSAWADYVSGQC